MYPSKLWLGWSKIFQLVWVMVLPRSEVEYVVICVASMFCRMLESVILMMFGIVSACVRVCSVTELGSGYVVNLRVSWSVVVCVVVFCCFDCWLAVAIVCCDVLSDAVDPLGECGLDPAGFVL